MHGSIAGSNSLHTVFRLTDAVRGRTSSYDRTGGTGTSS